MNDYLEVRNLAKSYADFRLHDITFTLPKEIGRASCRERV